MFAVRCLPFIVAMNEKHVRMNKKIIFHEIFYYLSNYIGNCLQYNMLGAITGMSSINCLILNVIIGLIFKITL